MRNVTNPQKNDNTFHRLLIFLWCNPKKKVSRKAISIIIKSQTQRKERAIQKQIADHLVTNTTRQEAYGIRFDKPPIHHKNAETPIILTPSRNAFQNACNLMRIKDLQNSEENNVFKLLRTKGASRYVEEILTKLKKAGEKQITKDTVIDYMSLSPTFFDLIFNNIDGLCNRLEWKESNLSIDELFKYSKHIDYIKKEKEAIALYNEIGIKRKTIYPQNR